MPSRSSLHRCCFIEGFYNPERIQKRLGYRSPLDFESNAVAQTHVRVKVGVRGRERRGNADRTAGRGGPGEAASTGAQGPRTGNSGARRAGARGEG